MKILIIKLSSLGDIVHSFPVLDLLRYDFPKAQIDWLVYENFSEILLDRPLNKIIKVRKNQMTNLIFKAISLRFVGYDLIIDLQGLIKTGFLAWLIGAKKILGFKRPRESLAANFYTQKVDLDNALCNSSHVVQKNLLLLEKGLNIPRTEFFMKKINEKHLPTKYKNVTLISCTTWESKFWTIEAWTHLIETLIKKDQSHIDLLGAKSDFPYLKKIYDSLDTKYKSFVEFRTDKKISELAEYFQNKDLVIGVDTGPLHIAAYFCDPVKTRVIGLYGPTSARRSGPQGWQYLSYDEIFSKKASHKRKSAADAFSMRKITYTMLEDKLYGLSCGSN